MWFLNNCLVCHRGRSAKTETIAFTYRRFSVQKTVVLSWRLCFLPPPPIYYTNLRINYYQVFKTIVKFVSFIYIVISWYLLIVLNIILYLIAKSISLSKLKLSFCNITLIDVSILLLISFSLLRELKDVESDVYNIINNLIYLNFFVKIVLKVFALLLKIVYWNFVNKIYKFLSTSCFSNFKQVDVI